VLKRPSHLIPIEPDNFAPGATVVDFENLPGTTLPVVPNLQFVRTSGSEMRWFAGKVSVEGSLFGEAYMINLATTRMYAELAIEFETPVEAVGAWVKKVPNFRDESPQSLTVVTVDPYLNTIRRRVSLPEVDGEPRFVGFSSEDGIVRFEWLGHDSGWFGVDEITFGAFAPLPRSVEIDIRPGNSTNRVQPENEGGIAVAILGADDFDVADVDRETVAFGPDGASPAHASGGHPEDVNGDGLMDLVSHYRTQETSLASGDTEACVTGETLDGIPFIGCDSVEVLTPRGDRWTPNR
jgi:hypothetical protein